MGIKSIVIYCSIELLHDLSANLIASFTHDGVFNFMRMCKSFASDVVFTCPLLR